MRNSSRENPKTPNRSFITINDSLTLLLLTAFLVVIFSNSTCYSQLIPSRTGKRSKQGISNKKKLSPYAFVVDRIRLKEKSQWLYGIILKEDSNNLEILIERQWLKSRNPALLKKVEQTEIQRIAALKNTTIRQIEDWQNELKSGPSLPDLEHFLSEQKTKIRKRSPAALPRFCMLKISKTEIAKIFPAKMQAKHLAGVAWKHKYVDISEKKVKDLQKEFQNHDIDPLKETFDLSGEMIPELITDNQWMVKKAIIRNEFDQQLRFQNVGGKFLKDGAKLKLNDILSMVAGNFSIENALGDIANDLPEFRYLIQKKKMDAKNPDWWKGIQKKLERQWKEKEELSRPTGLFVKRQSPAAGTSKATIQAVFVVRKPNGIWIVAGRFEASASSGDISEEQLENLQNDPRIKQALKLGQSLGIAGGEQIKQALRFGGMVQIASQKVDKQFSAFLSRHTKSLPGPSITLSK